MRTLNGELLDIDSARGYARFRFEVVPAFCHSQGTICQGGFLTGMVDTAMANAAIVKGKLAVAVPTLELKISFFEAMGPGIVYAEGRVMRWGGSVGFLPQGRKGSLDRARDLDDQDRAAAPSVILSAAKDLLPVASGDEVPRYAQDDVNQTGNRLSQCSAICRRVANQAPPFVFICATMRSRAVMRPGRPIMRRCSPIDIILGCRSPSAHSVS